MEIFNIHLFEFLLIAGLALIVFGPERLPEMGRLAGKQVARFLAWQQQSPELRLINEVRSDIEQEIASLRDELVRTRKQLDLSQDVSHIREELRPLISLRDPQADPSALLKLEASDLPPKPDLADPALLAKPDLGDLAQQSSASTELLAQSGDSAELLTSVGDSTELVAQVGDLNGAELAAQTATVARPVGPAGTVPTQPPNRILAPSSSGVLNQIETDDAYLLERQRLLAGGTTLDQSGPAAPPSQNGHTPAHGSLSASEQAALVQQVQTLNAELQRLIHTLRQRGILTDDANPTASDPEQARLSR